MNRVGVFVICTLFSIVSFDVRAQSDKGSPSIEAGICLTPSQLSALEGASKRGDLLAVRKIALYYESCVSDRDKVLAYAKMKADIGTANDMTGYATLIKLQFGKERAFPYYLKAARMGDIEAQEAVADSYRDGFGVAADEQQALTWFQIAARCQGTGINDMGELAEFLWSKRPAPLSEVKALAWLNVIQRKIGLYLDEKDLHQKIVESLSKEQINIADEIADEYFEQAGCANSQKVN